MKRAISILLAVVILFSGINLNAFRNVITAQAAAIKLDEWTVNAFWRDRDSNIDNVLDYSLNVAEDKQLELTLEFHYDLQSAKRDYLPGEIEFTFDGIGDVKRNSVMQAATVGASDDNWTVTYDSTNDRYTFTNKKTFKAESSSQGGTNMIWRISSREGVNGYKKDITPTFTVRDSTAGTEQTVNMENMNFEYNSTPDDFRLTLEQELISPTAYENADKSYVWYVYRTKLNSTLYARGLNKSNYFIQVDLPDGCSADDVIVITSTGKTTSLIQETINGKTVWGFYDYSVRNGDYRSNDGITESTFRIGYLANTFDGKTVNIYSYLNLLYNDETEFVLLNQNTSDDPYTAHVESPVKLYRYTYGGYGISLGKYNGYEGVSGNSHANPHSTKNMLSTRIFNGTTVEYHIAFSSSKTYGATSPASMPRRISTMQMPGEDQKYNVIISDSKMTIRLTGGTDRPLTADEYHFSSLRMPANSDNYAYEIYASTDIETPSESDFTDIYDENTKPSGSYKLIDTGDTSTAKTIFFDDNVHSFFVKILNT